VCGSFSSIGFQGVFPAFEKGESIEEMAAIFLVGHFTDADVADGPFAESRRSYEFQRRREGIPETTFIQRLAQSLEITTVFS
jgi:hypothetical protein